ncbi:type II secretion system F family protein [Actinoallomurus sp. NBC_01490]|uniref:type II secretion system F family protein n=1 Tax=Actinoallomurus sp. NBC_01490 TaxID=2903557 RepID=UPI002E2EE7A0|nr:type II secretion system F family protein [Actinoallomurus sp. NBC_01490]
MTSTPLIATLASALIITGVIVIGAALTGTDLLPLPPTGRPRRRLLRWRSRRTLAETVAVIGAAIGAWALTGWPVAGIAVAAAIIAVPRLLGGRAAQQRIARLEALETWTRQLADVLTTGTSIEDALLTTAEDPPTAIADQVTALRRRLEYRVATEDAVRAFADELGHPVADTIAATMIIASRMRGRGLREVLTALAKTVAEDVAMQRQVDAERATHRTTAIWVIAALAIFVGFAVINRPYVAPFGTATGQLMLVIVAALYAGAIWWLHRLTTPPPGRRFLTDGRKHR